MIIGILFVLEATVLIIVWLKYIIDYFRFEKKGIKLKQERLLRLGTTLATIGTVIGIVVPRLIGIRYDTSSKAQIVYLLITLLGVCLALLGFRFATTAYKTEEENPQWIKWLLHLWI